MQNFQQHYVEVYEEMLEDMENVEEENEKESAYNVVTNEMIEEILKESDKEEKEREQTAFVNVMQSNDKLLKMLKKLLQKENNKNNSNNNSNNQPGKMAWRKVAPKQGEEETKTFEGVDYKWCGKCRWGEGLWTKGDGLHGTADHDPNKRRKWHKTYLAQKLSYMIYGNKHSKYMTYPNESNAIVDSGATGNYLNTK